MAGLGMGIGPAEAGKNQGETDPPDEMMNVLRREVAHDATITDERNTCLKRREKAQRKLKSKHERPWHEKRHTKDEFCPGGRASHFPHRVSDYAADPPKL